MAKHQNMVYVFSGKLSVLKTLQIIHLLLFLNNNKHEARIMILYHWSIQSSEHISCCMDKASHDCSLSEYEGTNLCKFQSSQEGKTQKDSFCSVFSQLYMVSSTLLFSYTDEFHLESVTVRILVVRKFSGAKRDRKNSNSFSLNQKGQLLSSHCLSYLFCPRFIPFPESLCSFIHSFIPYLPLTSFKGHLKTILRNRKRQTQPMVKWLRLQGLSTSSVKILE